MVKRVEIRLKNVLDDRNIEQKQLAELTGLSERTVSELCNNQTKRIPKEALAKIVEVLNITDLNELIAIIDEEKAPSE
jgi:putative transcriptional regulator